MNIIDWALAGIFVLSTLWGAKNGFLYQLNDILIMAFALIVSYAVYTMEGDLAKIFLAFIGTIFILSVILRVIHKLMANRYAGAPPEISTASRIAGGVLGAWKGAVLVLLCVFSMHFLSGVVERFNPALSEQINTSFSVSLFKDFSRTSGVRALRSIYYFGEVIKESSTQQALSREVSSQLKQNASVRAILEDKTLVKCIQERDFKGIISHPKFVDLLKDKEFLKQFYSIDFEALYKQRLENK